MKHYRVNLDFHPSQRWTSVISDHLRHMPALEQAYQDTLKKEFGIFRFIIKLLLYIIWIPKSYKEELMSISKLSDVKYTTLLGLNLGIDFLCGCTSAGVKVNDNMVHLRNMDWDLNILRKLTCQIDYYRGNKLVFSSIQWVGFVGTFTAVKPGVSLSLNYRKDKSVTIRQVYNIIFGRQVPMSFQIRNVFENETDYEQISQYFQTTKSCSCYILICSSKTCTLIAKDEHNTLAPKTNGTRLVQTNHDHDLETRGGQWVGHNRLSHSQYARWCDGDELLLNSKERWLSCHDLIDRCRFLPQILNSPPVCNSQTIYSVIMNPLHGTFDVIKVYE